MTCAEFIVKTLEVLSNNTPIVVDPARYFLITRPTQRRARAEEAQASQQVAAAQSDAEWQDTIAQLRQAQEADLRAAERSYHRRG